MASLEPILSFVVLLFLTMRCADMAESDNNDWVDMTDMLRYDPMTKTMRRSSTHSSELIKSKASTEGTNSCCNPLLDEQCEVDKIKCPSGMPMTTIVSTRSSVGLQPFGDQCESDESKCPGGMPSKMAISFDGMQPSGDRCDSDFIVRHVRRLLRLLNIASGSNLEDLSWDVRISLTKEDIDVLRLYAKSKGSLQNLDRVLTSMVNVIDVMQRPNWMDGFKEKFILDEWVECMQKNALFACFLLWLLLAIMSTSIFRACAHSLYLIIFFVLLSTFWEWKALNQKAEALQRSDQSKFMQIPIECYPESMTYWQTFVAYFREGDRCHQYHMTTMTDSFWKVTPLEAATSALAKMIPVFGTNLGDGLGLFFSKFMSSFGYIERYFMLLFAVVIIFATMIVITMCVAKGLVLRPQTHLPRQRPMVEEVTNDDVGRQVKAATEPSSPSSSVIEKHFYHYYLGNNSVEKSVDIGEESSKKSQATSPSSLVLNCLRCKSSYEATSQELTQEESLAESDEVDNLNATGQGDSDTATVGIKIERVCQSSDSS